MTKPPALLDFQITIAAWRDIPRLRPRLQQAALVTHAHLPKSLRFPFSANVLLAGNAKVRQLNHDFRGMDKPTNVLSFPQLSPSELPRLGKHQGVVALGDIALAYQYVASEAKNEHKILINHTIHLVVHGLLHLFGYDHGDDRDAEHMEKLEMKIVGALGLPNPYAPFSGRKPSTRTMK